MDRKPNDKKFRLVLLWFLQQDRTRWSDGFRHRTRTPR